MRTFTQQIICQAPRPERIPRYAPAMASVAKVTSMELVEFALRQTALGVVLAASSARGLCWLAIGEGAEQHGMVAALLRRFAAARPVGSGGGPDASSAQRVLERAFDALERPSEATDLPLDLRGTPFQLAVWAQLRLIPAGSVISYAELARRSGRPRAFRAVAQACGANPVGVIVPCHRVIASDGSLGGFGFGLARKRELLRREGVDLQTRSRPSPGPVSA